jgi:hypothetical protein
MESVPQSKILMNIASISEGMPNQLKSDSGQQITSKIVIFLNSKSFKQP